MNTANQWWWDYCSHCTGGVYLQDMSTYLEIPSNYNNNTTILPFPTISLPIFSTVPTLTGIDLLWTPFNLCTFPSRSHYWATGSALNASKLLLHLSHIQVHSCTSLKTFTQGISGDIHNAPPDNSTIKILGLPLGLPSQLRFSLHSSLYLDVFDKNILLS